MWLANGPESFILGLAAFVAGGCLYLCGNGGEKAAVSGYLLFLAAAEGLEPTTAVRASAAGLAVVGLIAIGLRWQRSWSATDVGFSIVRDVEVAGRVLFAAPLAIIDALGRPYPAMPLRPHESAIPTGAPVIDRLDASISRPALRPNPTNGR